MECYSVQVRSILVDKIILLQSGGVKLNCHISLLSIEKITSE